MYKDMYLAPDHLVRLAPCALRIKDGPVGVDVANIEKLGVLETVFPTSADIRRHIVQFPEFPGEHNVALVR